MKCEPVVSELAVLTSEVEAQSSEQKGREERRNVCSLGHTSRHVQHKAVHECEEKGFDFIKSNLSLSYFPGG